MKKIQQLKYAVLCFSIIYSILGCDSMLDAKSDVKLKEEDHYKSSDEVYAALLGIQSTLQRAADQTIILSELRGDLLQPTLNASENFWNIYHYKVNACDDYSTARPYYDIVINCNDFLQHLSAYLKDNPDDIEESIRDGMVSVAINSKVWATMMVAKLFGEASFSHVSMDEIPADSILQPYNLTDLPNLLLDYMDEGENGINAYNSLNWDKILIPLSDKDKQDNLKTFSFRPEVLQGELFLWAGRYDDAKDVLIKFITSKENVYKVDDTYLGEDWLTLFKSDYNDLGENEILTGVAFDRLIHQQSKLQYYFSAKSPNVHYLNPTATAIELFESQRRTVSLGDSIRAIASFGEENGVSVVTKYHLDEEKDEFELDANIHIYRAAEVHLMLAEAYCFLGEYEAALAFVNNGIGDFKNTVTNDYEPPFQGIDDMMDDIKGIRGRVGLSPIEMDDLLNDNENFNDLLNASMSPQDSLKTKIAMTIADEVALELAYEGKRWFTLVRMARNLGNPEFLALPVSRKFSEGDQAYWKGFLGNEQNWFIR